jgi:NAD(P)-dependent dehydrogenase (short-subunit alcohol dehydrogenase family)
VIKNHSQVHPVQMDVEDDASILSAAEKVQSILKSTDDGLNLLINNAGICDKQGTGFTVPGAERAVFQRHLNVNSTGVVMVTQVLSTIIIYIHIGLHCIQILGVSSIAAEGGVHVQCGQDGRAQGSHFQH